MFVSSAEIEDSYSGPVLEDGQITLDFIEELMECYKNQKKIHKKYAYRILLDVKSYFQSLPSLVEINVPDVGGSSIVALLGNP